MKMHFISCLLTAARSRAMTNSPALAVIGIAAGLLAVASTVVLAPPGYAQGAPRAGGTFPEVVETGKLLFDRETFGGNGRTCETCHTKKTGTISIQEVQDRFTRNPRDPLFRAPDSDDGTGSSFSRLVTTGTIRIDVPLPSNVKVLDDPAARSASFFRGTPSVRNVTTLQHFLMSDGRESSENLQHQALEAVHQHTENAVEPTSGQLDNIALFEQANARFFSSKMLQAYAAGGPPPQLPAGNTDSEKRGRQFFNPDRQCGICHSGPMLDTSSEFDVLIAPGSRFHAAGAGLQLGPLDQAFDADGNPVLEPASPNKNQTFEFTNPDGSTVVFAVPDPGRALITGDPNDVLNFKIATLWGIKDTAPYFHDNSARTLEDVVNHYQRLFQFINDQVPDLLPLMSDQDKADVVAFLKLL
jgi:cytochrome c peroxidase